MKPLYTAPHEIAAEEIALALSNLGVRHEGKQLLVPEELFEQARERIHENEIRVRLRREEILMAGDGDEGMTENIARYWAWSEPLVTLLEIDGDHISVTDPDLADWIAEYNSDPIPPYKGSKGVT